MNESELKAIFEQLEAQGWQPMWCDAEIPSYDRSVPCGDPAMVYEDAPGSTNGMRIFNMMLLSFIFDHKGTNK